AGLIDGGGCLLLSKKVYGSLEITMGLQDEHALNIIKQKLGGSIKLRSGVKALRYRLHNTQGMIELIKRINGLIRHSIRRKQLQILCNHYNISFIEPILLDINNSWFAGFFDADGCIYLKKNVPKAGSNVNLQLSISVTNKYLEDVQAFKTIFNGNIYYDKSQNGYYKWVISDKQDILNLMEYFKKHTIHSNKKQRFHLVPLYYELKSIKAHQSYIDSNQYKAWLSFVNKWG
uniref:intron-encoded endonuclease family protein n=1 Tax=Limnomonas spitsbergensis TaxID=2954232 RepID=UPI002551FF51